MTSKKQNVLYVTEQVKNQYGSDTQYSGYDFEGTPDEIIAKMEAVKAQYGSAGLFLSWEQKPWEDSYAFYVKRRRPETDAEREARENQTVELQRRMEKSERETLARLKAKYEKA